MLKRNKTAHMIFIILCAMLILSLTSVAIYGNPLATMMSSESNTTQLHHVDSTVKMIATNTCWAYMEPDTNKQPIYLVPSGDYMLANMYSFGNQYIEVSYKGTICYIESTNLKAVIGESEELLEQLKSLAAKPEYPAQNVIDVMPAPTHYSVNGAIMPYNYQDFIWTICVRGGIEEYFPTLLCQFYQESRFNQQSVSSTNDYGICQLNAKYHDSWTMMVGHPEWDVKVDPYANMYIGVTLMVNKINNRNGDIDIAMTDYNAGGSYYGKYGIRYQYTDRVHYWETTLNALD